MDWESLSLLMKHESTRIETNRDLFGGSLVPLITELPHGRLRPRSRLGRRDEEIGQKKPSWLRGCKRAAASGDNPEKKPCIGTRFVSIRVDSCFLSGAGVSVWFIEQGMFSCKNEDIRNPLIVFPHSHFGQGSPRVVTMPAISSLIPRSILKRRKK